MSVFANEGSEAMFLDSSTMLVALLSAAMTAAIYTVVLLMLNWRPGERFFGNLVRGSIYAVNTLQYTTTRTYQSGIVQMSWGNSFPLLFSPSFFAYMLYESLIQLPPGGQGHPHPPSVFPHRIC